MHASDVCLQVVGEIPFHALPLRPVLCFLLSARWAAAHTGVAREISPALAADCVRDFLHGIQYNNNCAKNVQLAEINNCGSLSIFEAFLEGGSVVATRMLVGHDIS